ncbi:cyclase family protein [Methylotetracoccus oryzae]|uniref:cyclase family protein n=1 Tax=Methylotetracoccus oryzae TaxID=1919059 RepID=UPI001119E75B|nr:cyclase family protein [Methylotetracoccus oryzae]
MRINHIARPLWLALVLGGCASQPQPPWPAGSGGHWIDLTHAFGKDTIYWPTAEGFKLETVFDGTTEKGYHYSANQFCAAEHGGTHVDAPIHFADGAPTIDHVSLDHFIGPAVVVDVTAKAAGNRDYQVGIDDFTAFERQHGPIPPDTIVLLRTGFGRFWPNAVQYLGTAEKGPSAVAKLHFPGLGPDGARWLSEQRHIKAVGLDTASIDYGQSTLFESHQVLARAGIPIFENVAGLDGMPATGAWVVGLPMKIAGGSGAPLRLIARVP